MVTAWYAYVFGAMRGMSAYEAAKRTDINQSTFTRWKDGQAPDFHIAVKFARGMGISVLEALAATGLITPDEAGIDVGGLDITTVPTEDILGEIRRRLSENSGAEDGDGASRPDDTAGGEFDSDEAAPDLRAGPDRDEPEGRGGEVLDRAGDVAALPAGGPGPLVARIDPPEKELDPKEELKALKTPKGRWAQHHIATILGLQPTSWSKLLNGQIYPARLQTMQKIEFVFGWPVSEQVQLIPPYWEWPDQPASGKPGGDPVDLRYAIKLARVVQEWSDANPRDVSTKDLTLHEKLRPINKVEGPRFGPRQDQPEEPEPQAKPEPPRAGVWGSSRPLTVGKNPLVKR